MSVDEKQLTYAERRAHLREEAAELTQRLLAGDEEAVPAAAECVERLRSDKEFDLLEDLASALRKHRDLDGRVSKYLAQALIERGKTDIAVDVLDAVVSRLPEGTAERLDAMAMRGRAWKQQFFDAPDSSSQIAQAAFRKAVAAYGEAFIASNGTEAFPGVNLIALLAYAERNGIVTDHDGDYREIAKSLRDIMSLTENPKDRWFSASMAEIEIALGNLDAAERLIQDYVQNPDVDAFALGGTLRQFTELWCLGQEGETGLAILDALRAATLASPLGYVEITAEVLERVRNQPASGDLQAILGTDGQVSYENLQIGFNCALSVAAIMVAGNRQGTGFVVRGGDFIDSLGDESCLLTSAHVIGDTDMAVEGDVVAAFEAPPPEKRVKLTEILWTSGETGVDATLFRMEEIGQSIPYLRLAKVLPLADGQQRVYVIGHPLGRQLTYSLQDNRLLEHEGPTRGTPTDPAVRRLNYRAPTDRGNSGSPVLNSQWRVIGLHRAGSPVPCLNGRPGTVEANQGVWIQSIRDAAAASAGQD